MEEDDFFKNMSHALGYTIELHNTINQKIK